MKLPRFKYVDPTSLAKACRLLEAHGEEAMVIAGGTDLLQALKNRLKMPTVLVDLKNLPRLGVLTYSESKGLTIGAMVSLRHLANSPVVKDKYPVLAQAALQVASPQLQSMGTVGGNLCQDNLCLYYNRSPMVRASLEPCLKMGGDVCHAVSGSKDCWAVYSGDLAPVLMTLGAQVSITDTRGKEIIPLRSFYSGDGKKPNVLEPGRVVTAIRVPPPTPHSGATYFKLRLRKVMDYALLGVAANVSLRNGVCEAAGLALTGIDKAPLWIQEAQSLVGKRIGDEEIMKLADAAHRRAHPLNNVSELTPKYRRDMIDVYTRLAIERACETAVR